VREAPARIQLAARSSCGPQIDDAVKRFLSEKHGIDASSLVAVGCGKAQLKNTSDPFAADNRRVQVINMSDE
jgi:hypothetical protein